MLAILCPGQGAQKPGMLTPWLEVDGVRAQLAELSEVAGLDLLAHGTTSDAETIRDTAIAQPLIVASGLVALRALAPSSFDAVAGHSVGELTAAAAAGVLTETEALSLVAERGAAMAQASAVAPTGMSAVLGGDPEQVAAALAEQGLVPANVNGGGQVVAAGTLEELAALAAEPPARARVIPLKVAGAFHTVHMAPAVERLASAAARVQPGEPSVALLSNADGAVVPDGAQALARIVRQVANPVRWDLCMATLTRLGVSAVLELPPAGTLAGLAKRGMPGVEILALGSPEDLDAARALVTSHAGRSA